jgi:hypothetical protein
MNAAMTIWRSRSVRLLVELAAAAWIGTISAMVVIHTTHSPPIAPRPLACPDRD